MKLLLSNGLCGMTPQQGTIVGALYFIALGIMQLVFEVGHLRVFTEHNTQAFLSSNNSSSDNVALMYVYFYSLVTLESITLVLGVVLLVGVWFHCMSLILCFVLWLVPFDVAVVVLVSLLQVHIWTIGRMLSPLVRYAFVFRLLGDPFWLSFVITHGLQIRQKRFRVGPEHHLAVFDSV